MCKKLTCLGYFVLVLGLLLTGAANAASLVGWWKLDGNLLDSSGLANNGTLGGDPEFVAGYLGQALFFDGDDYVTMDGVADDVIGLTGNDFTMSAWVKTDDTTESDWLSVNSAGGGNVILFCINNQVAVMYDGGFEGYGTTVVTDGAWHMLTYVRRGTTGYIYVNGAQESTHEANYDLSADDRWSLGQEWDGDTPSDFLTGTLDEVRVYARPLTAQQVVDLFNGIAPTWLKADYPAPADGAEDVTAALLEWLAGDGAQSHDVYFGTSKTQVAAGTGGTSRGNQTATSFDPGPLLPGTIYYWRIDEKASDGTITPGDVWTFTMAEYLLIDDFEDYNDYPPDRIIDAWLDGYKDPANGSQVGPDVPPWAEQVIVHSGNQAMMMQYDNSAGSYLSWTERTFETPRDFTVSGLVGLTLWYRGQPAAVGGLSYNAATQTYTLTGSGSDIGGASDEFHYAFKQLTGVAEITVKVESLTDTDSWAKAGVMIRDTLDPDSVHGMVVVTPTGRVAFQFREAAGGNTHSTNTATGAITGPHWIKLKRSAAGLISAEHSANGSTWVPVESGDPADPSAWNIFMSDTDYIGLVVTAHDAQATCEATFSNVTVVGAAGGPFTESRDVGIASNSPERLYVTLEDNAGTPGTVYHEDGPEAILADEWQQWAIPLEDFEADGVDGTAVKKMVIGVGDKDNPQPGGIGKLYVDDIRVVRRMPTVGKVLLFEEDFEGLPLGPNVDEALAGDEVWTKTAPEGWTIDDSGVPGAGDPANDGVTEWAGWSFADKAWWVEAAGDQQRSQFVLAGGTVALVDPDEWDDLSHAPGLLNSYLDTPAINVSTIKAGPGMLQLKFDSSWRQEALQTANVTVRFDDGEPIEVMRWESAGGDAAFFKADATSEIVTVDIDRPAGAREMVVTFGMLNAGNNWWWAIDNVQVSGIPRERIIALSEDFEGMELGPSPEEDPSADEVWTDTPPAGWTVDESGVPGVGDPATDGVTDWAGWAFANKEFWINTDYQRREEFELGQGIVVVADGDEWSDSDRPLGWNVALDPYDTWLTTPQINIAGFEAGSVQLKFDSSWRPEYDSDYHQTANITVSYDGGDAVEILRWESDAASVNYKPDNSTNETIIVPLDVPPGATSAVLTFGYFDAGNDWWWAIDNVEVSGLPRERVIVLSEDFEGLELGPNVDEGTPGEYPEAWTDTPPAAWTIDDSGVPIVPGDPTNDGVTEWAGWSFADKDFWLSADLQRREEFTLGDGTIAVADSDEFDDKNHPAGTYNTFLATAEMDISRVEAGSIELTFDSSWRPESNQKANITVQFDGGAPVEVLRWESNSGSPNYHGHETNETVTVPINNPEGAKSMTLTFGYFDASNNWWWAIDNVVVSGYPKGKALPILIFSENFDGVTLTPSADEAPPGNFWTKTPPAGWNINDNSMPGAGNPLLDGRTEWAGWSFADKNWWVQVAGDQERSQFALGTGTVAIADPDEWDDAYHLPGTFNSFLDTAPISISGVNAGTVELKFDSSWRPYANQTADIAVSFDGGEWVSVLLWESDPASPNFKPDIDVDPSVTSETVTVSIANPVGAQSMVISFGLSNAGNDWWWAIDNVTVTGTSGASVVTLLSEDFEGLALGPSVEEAPPGNFWTDTPPAGWVVDDSGVPGAGDPANDGVTEWAGWSFTSKDWWVQVAGDQQRSEFEKGRAVVAVADPDEWDDLPRAEGMFNALLSTPAIDVSGVEPGILRLTFDSSWRQEDTQTANVTVSYDGGAPIEVMRWESEGGDPAFFKADATSETVTVEWNHRAGAQQMVITFGMLNAGDDWWWAIDNVKVTSIAGVVECFPSTNPQYNDWVALGKPDCWCTEYQCDGDTDGKTSGFPFNYRVFTGDLGILVANWKKTANDPALDPCADVDHKSSGFPFNYRVFTADLGVLVANWKKTDAALPGNCPRP